MFSAYAEILPLAADPMQPKIKGLVSHSTAKRVNTIWSLQAVNIRETNKHAIINGQIVYEGQQLAKNVMVKQIRANRVVLNNQGKEQILKLALVDNIKRVSDE
jgi:hypothetical protein